MGDLNLENSGYKMSSEILEQIWELLKSPEKTLRSDLFKARVLNLESCLFCLFLLTAILCFYKRTQRNTYWMKYLSESTASRMKRTKMPSGTPYWLTSCTIDSFKLVFFAVFLLFLVLSLYFSLYDDTKASVITFLGVALNVWTTKLAFSGIRCLDHPFLKIMEYSAYFLVVSGLLLLVLKFWTVGFYLACVGKIIEKYLNEKRRFIRISHEYLQQNGEPYDNDSIQIPEDPEISHPVKSAPENECDQQVFLDPELKVSRLEFSDFLTLKDSNEVNGRDQEIIVDAEEEMDQLELSDFLQLEDSNQVNSVINNYFEELPKTQQRSNEIGGPSKKDNDTVNGGVELKNAIYEFAQMLEGTEDHENNDQLVQDEVTLEDCYETNLLTREFVRQLLKVYRRDNRQFIDDQEMNLKFESGANLLANRYVDLINEFNRQLTLNRKNRILFDKRAVNEMNEQRDRVASVDRDFEHGHVEISENKLNFPLPNLEDLDNAEISKSLDEMNKIKNLQIAGNDNSEVQQNRRIPDIGINESSIEYTSDGNKSVENEFVSEVKNIGVPDHNVRNKPSHEMNVGNTSIYSRIPFKKRLSKRYQQEPPKKRLSKRYREELLDDDLIKRCEEHAPNSPIMNSAKVRKLIERFSQGKVEAEKSVQTGTDIVPVENSDFSRIANVVYRDCEFHSVESKRETEQPVYSHSESDADVLKVDQIRTGEFTQFSQSSPIYSSETRDKVEVTNEVKVQLVSEASQRELLPGSSFALEANDCNSELKRASGVLDDHVQGGEHVLWNEQNTMVYKEIEHSELSRKLSERNAFLLQSSDTYEKNFILTQCFKDEPLISPNFEPTKRINYKEMVSLDARSFTPTIAFNSRINIELVKGHSSQADLSTNRGQMVECETKALIADADNKTQSLPTLSCVEDVVNRIDVSFIYGLT